MAASESNDMKLKFDFLTTAKDILSLQHVNLTENVVLLGQINEEIVKNLDSAKSVHAKIMGNFEQVYEFCRITKNNYFRPIFKLCTHSKAYPLKEFIIAFLQNIEIIELLPRDIRVYELEKPDGIFATLCDASKLNGLVFSSLHEILCDSSDENDYSEFLFCALEIYILNLWFVIKQYNFLAQASFERGNLIKFAEHCHNISLKFMQLKVQLVGKCGLIEMYKKKLRLSPNMECKLNMYKCEISNFIFPFTFDHIVFDVDLLSKDPNLRAAPKFKEQKDGLSFLHISVFVGPQMIESLLNQNNIDVNAKSDGGLTALHMAVIANSLDATKALLKKNDIDVNTQSDGGYTPLHFATMQGNLEIVKILLKNSNIDVNKAFNGGWTALHTAVAVNNENVVAELLKAENLNLNAKMTGDISPLHLAARIDSENLIRMLCENQINSKAKTTSGLTAYEIAKRFNCANALRVLKEKKFEKTQPSDELNDSADFEETASNNYANVLKYLIKYHVKIDLKDKPSNTLLQASVAAEQFDAIKFLLEHRFIDLNINDLGKQAALYTAAQDGDSNAVEFLLNQGIDIEATDENGMSALLHATLKGRLEILDLLVKNDANVYAENGLGKTVLHFAVMSGNLKVIKYFVETLQIAFKHKGLLTLAARLGSLDILKYLIEKRGLNPHLKLEDQETPICAAIIGGHFETVKYLIEDQGVVVSTDFEPLHFAIESNKLEIVEYLLDHGANINAKSPISKITPILLAAKKSGLEVFRLLLDRGANISESGLLGNILHYACETVNLEIIKYLVDEQNFDLNIKLLDGCSPLMHAAEYGTLEAVKYFVEDKHFNKLEKDDCDGTVLHYAALNKNVNIVQYFVETLFMNIKARSSNGFVPLFCAAQSGNLEIVKYFVFDRKLGVYLKDKYNRSILHIAAYHGHLDIVRYLVEEHGADIRFEDNEGCTPLLLSIKGDNIEVVKYLLMQETLIHKTCLSETNILHYAVEAGKSEIVRYLIEEKNIDVNARDINGRTPLFYAKQPDVVKYLEASGADL